MGADAKTETQAIVWLQTSAVFYAGTDKLAEPVTINGFSFPKESRFFFNFPDKTYGTYLAQDTLVLGLPSAKGSLLKFFNNGKINMATLSQDITIRGRKLLKGSEVTFSETGDIKEFNLLSSGEARTIQGISFPKETTFFFYGTGKLREAQVPSETKIQNIFCAPRGQIKFYENGQLQSVEELERPALVQGLTLNKGFEARFSVSGKLDVTRLKEETKIRSYQIPAGSLTLSLQNRGDYNGEIEMLQLGQDTVLDGVTYPMGSVVRLTTDFEYSRSALEKIMLSRDTVISGIPAAKGTWVTFPTK